MCWAAAVKEDFIHVIPGFQEKIKLLFHDGTDKAAQG